MNEILVIGSVALDTIRAPLGIVKNVLGGSATYFSVSASFFNRVNLVATIGEDFPSKNVKLLKSFGINTTGMEIKKGQKTFCWEGSYMKDLNCAQTIKTQLNVFARFKPNIPTYYTKSRYLFLANIDPDLQLFILRNFKTSPLVGCDSMNYWIENKKRALKKLLREVDIMFLNDTEAKMLSGEYNILKAGRALLSLGPKFAIIKRGEYGSILVSSNNLFCIPAYLLEKVYDPTGAGDSFAGGFIGYLAKVKKLDNHSLRKALLYGTIMASFACEDFSITRFLSVKKKDIEARYNRFRNLISIS